MLMSSFRDLHLRHLLALDAVASEGTFARAAERLGYTQSAVSQQIAALERTVGEKVFDRPGGPRAVELTPFGAEQAGNANGTIPAWDGGITTPPAGYQKGMHHPDPYADDQVLFTITAENMEQYADKLTAGQQAMLKAYPSYKMNVYPTRRSASFPTRRTPIRPASPFVPGTRRAAARAPRPTPARAEAKPHSVRTPTWQPLLLPR